ncbi:uncharacterized protein N7482_004838 [Penicillium canariense]|uniref:Uncharacterized protein n=1 Tax=Penicillium canariense TaxID=189055 RepID=A0A9W9I738_9EURO|nr:uncharacterized protein N7482_004838 [Penicillium canariense]KAJ5169244.1 hypothetical protein N7482_004838 [Penicillium canariense]
MQGSARRNIMTFRDLCGEDALKKVILVTTMWDKVSSSEGNMREQELKDKKEFWGYMMGKGSTCHRHENTKASARDIVHLLAKHKNPIVTDNQKQLVDQNLNLDQTSAGKGLQSETLKERAKWMKERQQFEQELREARLQQDREREEIIREEQDIRAEMIRKADQDMAALRLNMENLLAKREEREAQMEKRMEERLERQMQKKQAAHDKEIKRIRMKKEAELEAAKKQQKQARRELEKLERKKEEMKAEQERKAEQKRNSKALQASNQTIISSSNAAGYSPWSVTMGENICAVSGPKSYKWYAHLPDGSTVRNTE